MDMGTNIPMATADSSCCFSGDGCSVSGLLFRAATMVPLNHYVLVFAALVMAFLYSFLEIHFLRDFIFCGDKVVLTFDSASEIYHGVVSKCRVLHGRYLATPWLASPHFQTTFLNFHGRPPSFTYRRQLFTLSDGGTIALDWVLASDVTGKSTVSARLIPKDDKTPLIVVVPGLTSDSSSAYMRHLVYSLAEHGWNVIVSNHRGLGGMSITSDCFYNAGWTEDIREVVKHMHQEYPMAPLFAVGTSIGANILVKYLGEEGENTPVAGAASICSPWDLVVCDRFICRNLVQRFYDKALAIGLKGYAELHQNTITRLANWEGIKKSRSIREFDDHATRHLGKYETVDTYYRRCSSVNYIGGVSVPLLCFSALDDPLCTKEAIPWDECRANKNVVLATTEHGGHLGCFEGWTASRLWWVRAVREFIHVLHNSPYMHVQKQAIDHQTQLSVESSVDQGPYVNIMEDGLVAAVITDSLHEDVSYDLAIHGPKPKGVTERELTAPPEPPLSSDRNEQDPKPTSDLLVATLRRSMGQLVRYQGRSIWLLAYIAFASSWPLLGSLALLLFRRKLKIGIPSK